VIALYVAFSDRADRGSLVVFQKPVERPANFSPPNPPDALQRIVDILICVFLETAIEAKHRAQPEAGSLEDARSKLRITPATLTPWNSHAKFEITAESCTF